MTILWGILLGLTAASLLLAGGEDALSGLQSIMVVSALPFAFVIMGIMFAWAKDLRTDPFVLRYRYAQAAIAQGIRKGIEDYGDHFVFEAGEVESDEGAGAWLDTEDPELTEWFMEATEELSPVAPRIFSVPCDPAGSNPRVRRGLSKRPPVNAR